MTKEIGLTDISFARFEGRVTLISGAANGIWRVGAGIIAAEGGTIAAMEAFAAAGGGEHHAYPADALHAEEVDAVVVDVVGRFGKIDILINGVGGSTIIANSGARAEELTLEEWQRVLDFILSDTFLFCDTVAFTLNPRCNSGVRNANVLKTQITVRAWVSPRTGGATPHDGERRCSAFPERPGL